MDDRDFEERIEALEAIILALQKQVKSVDRDLSDLRCFLESRGLCE